MLLENLHCIGSQPTIRIGRRQYRHRDGTIVACQSWTATWHYRGRSGYMSLRTLDEPRAIEMAVQLRTQLLSPEGLRLNVSVGFTTLLNRYLKYQRQRNHAPRTIQKYDLVL